MDSDPAPTGAPATAAMITEAADAVRGAGQVALACHMNPDGDALGSMLALLHVLRAAGCNVVASFPSPFRVAPHYRDLPGLELLTPPTEFPSEPDVMVTFDCGSLSRLGDLEPAAKGARQLVVIDHHVSNQCFGSINVVEPAAAASGVVVQSLIDALGLPLNRDAAVCLYAALICDTGRFQYESTTCDVFGLAQELAQFDLPIAALSRTLFEEHRFAYLKVLGEALAAAELDTERRFVSTIVTQDMLQRHDVTMEEIEGLIDIVRRATEADVTCVLKEDHDGSIRVSLRSLGDVDVREIAVANGGGGHRYAAGFESTDPAAVVLERIRGAIPA